jgi:hypothetical protein
LASNQEMQRIRQDYVLNVAIFFFMLELFIQTKIITMAPQQPQILIKRQRQSHHAALATAYC